MTLSRSAGLSRVRVTVWVIPWHLLALLAVAGLLFVLGRRLWGRRGVRHRAIQSDIQRIERLLSQQYREGRTSDEAGGEQGARVAMSAAIKQARRAGDFETVERLERKLAEAARVPTSPAAPE